MTCPCEQTCAGDNPNNALKVVTACEPTLFHTVRRPANLGDETVTPPESFDYKNVLLVYMANGHAYLYSSDGVPTFISYLPTNTEKIEQAIAELEQKVAELQEAIAKETSDREEQDAMLLQQMQEAIAKEASDREASDNALSQSVQELSNRVEEMKNSPDVVDIVQTYADLEAYNTSTLGDKDIIRVLDDETRDDASAYYRWNKPESKWEYIGQTTPGIISSDKPGDITVNADRTASMNGYDGIQHDIQNLTELTQGRDTPIVSSVVVSGFPGAGSDAINAYVKYSTTNTSTGAVDNQRRMYLPVVHSNGAGIMTAADKTKLDSLLDITAIGDGLTLEAGTLSATGGSDVTLLDTYTASPEAGSAYSASYVNGRLDEYSVKIGRNVIGVTSGSVAIGHNAKQVTTKATDSVVIGHNTRVSSGYGVVVGMQAEVGSNAVQSVAIGPFCDVSPNTGKTANYAVAIGASSRAYNDNEFSIGNQDDRWTVITRKLTNLAAGESDTDAVNLKQMQNYVAEHGSSATLYDEYGANTDGALTQAFVSGKLNSNRVSIGSNSQANGSISVAIGANANVENGATGGVAIGVNAEVMGPGRLGSIAIGQESRAVESNVISIGNPNSVSYKTRRIVNVAPGVNSLDAVNVAQMKSWVTETGASRANNLPIAVVTGFEDTLYNTDNITLHLDTKDLASGGVAVQELVLNAAVGQSSGVTGNAGIMSALQATQLATLAGAYEAEEKGTVLYTGTASVNSITLSETASNFDHLVVVGEYMGMGSSAVKQSVSVMFYPTTDAKSFQMNAIDITVGDTPMETTIQDIWMLSDDGLDLDFIMGAKCEKGAGTLTATPETTSNFTILKVVGFGKL